MKTCFKCYKEKPLTEFYTHPQMGDGHLNKCKECNKADSVADYRRKIVNPKWKLSERRRSRLRARLARSAGLMPKITAEAKKGVMARYKLRYPEKWLAISRVQRALRTDKLTRQSCERCHAEKTQAHHDDYSKPLDVRWLCAPCHAAHHVALREAALTGMPLAHAHVAIPAALMPRTTI